jgi:hypothetical protein
MSDRGPNQDFMHLDPGPEKEDAKYRHAGYLGTSPDDEEEVEDLGFIVDDHDDRRASMLEGWQRLDDLDTNEPLETNRSGEIPHREALIERGAPGEWFATDYNVSHARAEAQEEDFVRTSMLNSDPDMNDGDGDFTDETLTGIHGEELATDLYGHVGGAAAGLGTSLPQDAGMAGFQIRDNPLMQPIDGPEGVVTDEGMGIAFGEDDYVDGDDEDRPDGPARGGGAR